MPRKFLILVSICIRPYWQALHEKEGFGPEKHPREERPYDQRSKSLGNVGHIFFFRLHSAASQNTVTFVLKILRDPSALCGNNAELTNVKSRGLVHYRIKHKKQEDLIFSDRI
jgi:hypothetical protein